MNRFDTTNPTPFLTHTIAIRLTLDECRALFDLARQADRTVRYIVRAELRKFLRDQRGISGSSPSSPSVGRTCATVG